MIPKIKIDFMAQLKQYNLQKYLKSLKFTSPYSVTAGIPEILKSTIIKNEN